MRLWRQWLLAMITVLASVMLAGCIYTSGAAFGVTTGASGLSKQPKKIEYYVFDVPGQVIYQIDDNRFFTMENYKDCDHGGIVYYHDTHKNIKKYITGSPDSNAIRMPNSMLYWKGEFIYAADDNVIASLHRYTQGSDRDTNYGYFIGYIKNDQYGQINITADSNPGVQQVIIITNEKIYIRNKRVGWGYAYPLPATSLNNMNISNDIPESVENDQWPATKTPTGATRFTCDNSIRPASVKVTPSRVFATDATGIPQYDQ